MELLDGDTLADRLARGPLPMRDVLRYGREIAAALDRAHRAGVVHRDLKPGNVMITKSGAKLLDFGLAKGGSIEISPDGATQQKSLTQEGTIVGTFQYMAPEQLEGVEADARTDIFALGAVLYEMATGKRAFEGKTKTSLIAAIVSGHPTPVSQVQPLTPRALEHVIERCLEKDPLERWQSAHDVAAELRWTGKAPEVIEKPRDTRLFVLIVLIAVVTTAGGTWSRDGVIVFAPSAFGPLYKVSDGGGVPVAVTKLDVADGETDHRWPAFLPDGRRFLYLSRRFAARAEDPTPVNFGGTIEIGSTDAGLKKMLFASSSNAVYSRSGHLLYWRDRSLVAQQFNPRTLAMGADIVPIAERVFRTGRW